MSIQHDPPLKRTKSKGAQQLPPLPTDAPKPAAGTGKKSRGRRGNNNPDGAMGNGDSKSEDATGSIARGYMCEFIDPPPNDLRCIMCLRPAQDPQQSTCCGRLFCKFCLAERKKTTSECPQCHEPVHCFYDRASDARIKQFSVHCSKSDEGCEWVGQLRDLEEHLEGCDFSSSSCPKGCGEAVLKSRLEDHVQFECPLRMHKCSYCDHSAPYREITKLHPKVRTNVRTCRCAFFTHNIYQSEQIH